MEQTRSRRRPPQTRQPDQLMMVKFFIIVAVILAVIILVAEGIEEKRAEQTAPTEPSVTTEPTQAGPPEGYELARMTQAEMAAGDLVLVNSAYGFDSGKVSVVTLHDRMDDTYYVADWEISVQERIIAPLNQWLTDFYNATGINDTLVVAGYRTVEYQQGLYDQAVQTKGQEHADAYIALPEHSEHHTGLAVDFDTYTSEGILGGFDGEGEFTRLVENAWKYGFIQRYPPAKSDITGISYEAWHFRYVGLPHSGIMAENDLCMEEYIDFLKKYPFEGDHLKVELLGKSYEIYYCKGLEVTVPVEGSYTISGNNVDGFIVTIEG